MHLLVLFLLGSVLAFDALGGRSLLAVLFDDVPVALSAALTLGPMIVVTLVHWWITARCARAIDRTGRGLYVHVAQRMSRLHQWGVTLAHVAGVFLFGWVNVVRETLTGDLVAIDELLIVTPALALYALGWSIRFGIERRLREAEIFRLLDEGRPVHESATRGQFVLDQFRHQVLIILIPLTAIIAWRETVIRLFPHSPEDGRLNPANELLLTALEFAGVIAVLVAMPFALRHIWSTRPLAEGSLRDRLMGMCERAGVRTRELLVWLTHGMMYNGAVVGLFGAARYILLTDGLLEEMDEKEVEAVMAHEIGHVVHHHIAWLMASLIASAIVAAGLVALLVEAVARTLLDGAPGRLLINVVEIGTLGVALGAGLLVFGHVSRRFERQADAFAVRMLARERAEEAGVEPRKIDEISPHIMIGALDRVAELNHIPKSAFMWRHGSIRSRQRALETLVGQPIDMTSIDRRARAAKRFVALLVVLAIALVAVGL